VLAAGTAKGDTGYRYRSYAGMGFWLGCDMQRERRDYVNLESLLRLSCRARAGELRHPLPHCEGVLLIPDHDLFSPKNQDRFHAEGDRRSQQVTSEQQAEWEKEQPQHHAEQGLA